MGTLCSCFQGEADEETERLLDDSNSRSFERVQDIPGAPTEKKWYHGGITDAEANYRVRSVAAKGGNGTYIVYDNPSRKGEYVLLVYKDGELHRWRIIKRKDNKYVLGEDKPGVRAHDTVRKLIKYHRGINGKPIMLEHGGRVTLGDYAYV